MEQEVAIEIRRPFLQLRRARERTAASEEAAASAQEDLRLAEERYRLRTATVLKVVDAQVALTEARNAQAEAIHELQLAKLSMEKATGTLSAR